MSKSFGVLKVNRLGNAAARLDLRLTFDNRDRMEETSRQLRKKGYVITDEFWGYSVSQSVEDAVHLAEAMLGVPGLRSE